MKNIFKLVCGFALVALTACGDDFLSHEPTDQASQDQIDELIKNDPEAVIPVSQAYLSGIYADMITTVSSHDDFGVKAIELSSDMMTDDMAYKSNQWFVFDYRLDNRTAPYRRPRSTWATYYYMIRGANSIINLLKPEDETAEMDEEAKNILGQAYAIRGYANFGLINRFQQPYSTDKTAAGVPITTEDERLAARQPVEDVYTLILSDLKMAVDLLEGLDNPQKRENINEYAAAAILANVIAFVDDYPNQWKEVVKYCNKAMQGGVLFDNAGLMKGFNSVDLSEVLWGSRIDEQTNTFYASFFSHVDPLARGYADILQQYKQVASELVKGTDANDYRAKWYQIVDKGGEDTYLSYKFKDVGNFESDYIYYRVAEMYFLKAEALLEQGNVTEAQATLEAVMMTRNPQYNVNAAGRSLKEEIYFQKRVEFWGEGKRFLDMRRRGEDLDRTKSTNHAPGTLMSMPANDRRWIYQIPQVEMDANSEITGADQNE